VSKNTKVIQIDGTDLHNIDLPPVFETVFRPDIIHKAYVNLLSHSFQKQGRYPMAGEMVSAESRNTGLGIARIARARGEGFARAGQGAGVAGVRHGRAPHPPESWKKIYKKINKKEKRLALCLAIAATAEKDIIKRRGHKVDNISSFPIVVSNEIESITKTKDLRKSLNAVGLAEELIRADSSRKSRSGIARRRHRASRSATSVLIVVGNDETIGRLSRSIPGIDIKQVKRLSVLDLSPGSKPVRLTVFSESAIKQLNDVKVPLLQLVEKIDHT
jgi:large subunit ribosomal protein L4e